MKFDLNTLCSVITTIAICSVLNTEPAASAPYNGAFHLHHGLNLPFASSKGYGPSAPNPIHDSYSYLPGGYQYHYPHSYPHHHHHHYPHVPAPPPPLYDPHHEDNFLRESAKDPRNLKNGILQNGAITYDLGMPRYEIINGHEAPEIITSDQPHYQEHLRQLQATQNFTLEDFDIRTEPPVTTAAATTETVQKPETTTAQPYRDVLSSRETHNIQRSVHKELSNARDKLQNVSDQVKAKFEENSKALDTQDSENKDVNIVVIKKNEYLSKKMKPAPFKATAQKEKKEDVKVEKTSQDQAAVAAKNESSPKVQPNSAQEAAYEANEQQPSQSEVEKSPQPALASIPTYVDRPILSPVPDAMPSLPVPFPHSALPIQYTHSYEGFPGVVGSSAPGQLPISVANMQRLYREVPFLENDKESKDAEVKDSSKSKQIEKSK